MTSQAPKVTTSIIDPLSSLPSLQKTVLQEGISSTKEKGNKVSLAAKVVEEKLHEMTEGSQYASWLKKGERYQVSIRPFPHTVSRDTLLEKADEPYVGLRAEDYPWLTSDKAKQVLQNLLYHKKPTKQTSKGEMVWDLSFKDAQRLVNDREIDCFPNGSHLRYPSFINDAKSLLIQTEHKGYFDPRRIFEGATCFEFLPQPIFFMIECTIPQDWQKLESSDPSKALFEQLTAFKEGIESDEGKVSWGLDEKEIKTFMESYYAYSRAQKKPLFPVRPKPITLASCLLFFEETAKQKSFAPAAFTLYRNRLEISSEQGDWNELLASMPLLVTQSGDKKNWVIPRSSIRTFFEHVRSQHDNKDDLLVSFLRSIDLYQSLQDIQIIYSKNSLVLFFTSETPYFNIIEQAKSSHLGTKVPVITRHGQYRKGLKISKEQWPEFAKILEIPQTVQTYVNNRFSS